MGEQSASLSLPSRERGSKLDVGKLDAQAVGRRSLHGSVDRNASSRRWPIADMPVAPFTGAWIETLGLPASHHGSVDRLGCCARRIKGKGRSLHGSVDRNSKSGILASCRAGSLPSRERGSKHSHGLDQPIGFRVAPFTGAWIETRPPSGRNRPAPGRSLHGSVDRNSQPSKAATTPLVAPFTGAWIETSWKPRNSVAVMVAPFTGAWIETRITGDKRPSASVAPFTGAWIETSSSATETRCDRSLVAPFTGAWIETTRPMPFATSPARRSLHGSVDRNPSPPRPDLRRHGRSLHGSVDRNLPSAARRRRCRCRSLHGSVDRNFAVVSIRASQMSRSLHGSVDRNTGEDDEKMTLVVAPFTGAWIETGFTSSRALLTVSSLPSRERGSKLTSYGTSRIACPSLPSRERGSKLLDAYGTGGGERVAPFTGAWIETRRVSRLAGTRCGRSLHGSVDRNIFPARLLRGTRPSLPSRERGSKLDQRDGALDLAAVAPFTGAWIETDSR